MRITLRAKGILAFTALTAYVSAVATVLGMERQKLLDIAIEIEAIHESESAIAKTGFALDHAQLRLEVIRHDAVVQPSMVDDLALDIDLVLAGLQAQQKVQPSLVAQVASVSEGIEGVRRTPSKTRLAGFQASLAKFEETLDDMTSLVQARRRSKWEEYYRVYDRMTIIAVATMAFAAMFFGAMVSLFFSRMAWDIRKLESRAEGIVGGYRGAPLAVTREDEIGGLMEAVNRMQSQLRRHEQQLELARQQRFHQEKMAAVGSLAAAISHEVNNPIAAIAGIARSISAAGAGGATDFTGDGPKLILEHAERVSAISRQMAEFTRPHPPRPELIDLNRHVEGVCRFTGYDNRLNSVRMTLDLDPELPAVECVADHVTQVVMNLLINSGDALAGIAGRSPEIRVVTRREKAAVALEVHDNGKGMDAATLERAFEEGFSTKASGQGLGLGLFLCKALVEGDGGSIGVDSRRGEGTTVALHIPLRSTVAP